VSYSDPETMRKQARKPAQPKAKPEIRIWRTQPKLDLLEAAIGQLCDREPQWRRTALALAKEARLERLLKVLESFDKTAASRQQEINYE
jgi:hypothetical protein